MEMRQYVQENSRELAPAQEATGQNGNGNLHRKVVYIVVDLAHALKGEYSMP